MRSLGVCKTPLRRHAEPVPIGGRGGRIAVWASDHFHPWQDNQGHAGFAWTTLAALGQRTARLALGTGVTCPPYRYNPAIVAAGFASLSLLYPGRVFLGVGTGEAMSEVPTGGGWGAYAERAARLVEALRVIGQLWTGDWVSHDGRYYHMRDARLYDPSSQQGYDHESAPLSSFTPHVTEVSHTEP